MSVIWRETPYSCTYIPLNSARRAVSEQARLFRQFVAASQFDVGTANPANRPGSSNHEYGFAIDVDLNSDAEKIIAALVAAGWVNTVPAEAWHYEAVSAAGYVEANNKREQIHDTLGQDYASLVVQLFTACNGKTASVETCSRLRGENAEELRELDQLSARLEELRAEGKSIEKSIQDTDTKVYALREARDAVRRRLDSRKYDLCPNGQPYAQCTHEDLKRTFRDWQTSQQREIEKLEGEINRFIAARESLTGRQRQINQQLRETVRKYRQVESALKREHPQLFEADKRIRESEVAIPELLRRLRELETTIAREVLQAPKIAMESRALG